MNVNAVIAESTIVMHDEQLMPHAYLQQWNDFIWFCIVLSKAFNITLNANQFLQSVQEMV